MPMPTYLSRLMLPASLGLGLISATTGPTTQMAGRPTTSLAQASPELYLVTAASGNEVRYRVQEKLIGITLPYEAIGRTNEITGGIMLDSLRAVVPGKSKFVIH